MLAPAAVPFAAAPPRPRRARRVALGAAALTMVAVVAVVIGGEGPEFALAGVPALALAVLAAVTRLGSTRRWARVLAVVLTGALVVGLGLLALGLTAATLVDPVASGPGGLVAGGGAELLLVALGLGAAGLAGVVPLLPSPRRALARVVPIDPSSFPSTVAAAAIVAATLMAFVPLLVLGTPPMLKLSAAMAGEQGVSNAALLRGQVYGLLWLLPAAAVAAGWGLGRDRRAVLVRLGLVRPTRRQVLGGLGLAVVLVGASALLDAGIGWVWGAMGWSRTDGAQVEQLFAFAFSPIGALVLGTTAGLGEELVVRGLLQPRLGLVLANLCFTATHALQYNWDALLSVFLIGLILGLVRRRTNTTTSALVHGALDALLVLSASLGLPTAT